MLNKYVRKGNQIGIVGEIQTRSYDDKNGQRHYVTEVLVETLEFLESKTQESNQPSQPMSQPSNNGYQQSQDKPQDFMNEKDKQAVAKNNPFDEELGNVSSDDLPF